MTSTRTIFFAGGGSGGHIFPNLAVWEQVCEKLPGAGVAAHFLVSERAVDARIMEKQGVGYTVLAAQPAGVRPRKLVRFLVGYYRSVRQVRELIESIGGAGNGVMVCTGGFVSAPAVAAAVAANIPVAMVNLDAVPGKANRLLAHKVDQVFTLYDTPLLRPRPRNPRAEKTGSDPVLVRIGMPLRRAAIGASPPEDARRELGLDPKKHTLAVFAGSQGGESINRMMVELVSRAPMREALGGWQIYHVSGAAGVDQVRRAYSEANFRGGRVEAFCDRMDWLWSAATLVVCRAGAGSVAEVWANAVPAIFLPYPYHRDEHQRLNAQPLVDAGGAVMVRDWVDPVRNADAIGGVLAELLADADGRGRMAEKLRATAPTDGAEAVCRWIQESLISDL